MRSPVVPSRLSGSGDRNTSSASTHSNLLTLARCASPPTDASTIPFSSAIANMVIQTSRVEWDSSQMDESRIVPCSLTNAMVLPVTSCNGIASVFYRSVSDSRGMMNTSAFRFLLPFTMKVPCYTIVLLLSGFGWLFCVLQFQADPSAPPRRSFVQPAKLPIWEVDQWNGVGQGIFIDVERRFSIPGTAVSRLSTSLASPGPNAKASGIVEAGAILRLLDVRLDAERHWIFLTDRGWMRAVDLDTARAPAPD